MKAQARAQKDAARFERDRQRAQTWGPRRTSIVGPLLLVAIGIVALLISTGRLSMLRFAGWYAYWWPLLIVLAGLLMVGEWALEQFRKPEGVPFVRRGLGGGGVTLLIFLVIFGFTSRGVHDNHDLIARGLSINPDNFEEIFGDKYEREQQIDQAFAAGTSLSLDNPHGDVAITGQSGDGQIHITLNKRVYGRNEQEADTKADALKPVMQLTGNTLHVTVPGREGVTADVSVTLPAGAGTSVNVDHGEVHVTGMNGPVNVTSNNGDVELNTVAGAVMARMNSSHASFAAHNVTGDVQVKGRADDLNVTDVTGMVSLEGEFFGDTHLERLGGLTFQTNRTQFTLGRLNGEVDISPDSELSGDNIAGPTELRTRSRNINLQHVAGPVNVTNSNGTVDLTDALPLGAVTIDNSNGAVNVTLPDRVGVSLSAETRDGEVENEFGLTTVGGNDRNSVTGTVGDGGTRVSVRTSHADISLHKMAMIAPPAAPAAPVMPAVKGKGGKLTKKPVAPATPAVPGTQTF